MVRPLSEQFADLSARLKEAEDSVEAAAHKEREKVDSRLTKLHADASARGDRIKQDVSEAGEDISSKWHELQNKFRSDVDNIKQDIDDRRYEHDANRAAKKAEKAEDHAAAAIAFALSSIAYAEEAVLDAIVKRWEADSY